MADITYLGNCELCGKRKTAVHKHHLVPKRLLKKLDFKHNRRWKYQVVTVCNTCDSYLHPENKLYAKIEALEYQLRKGK